MCKMFFATSLLETHQSADEDDFFSFRSFSWMFWNFVVDGVGDEIDYSYAIRLHKANELKKVQRVNEQACYKQEKWKLTRRLCPQ